MRPRVRLARGARRGQAGRREHTQQQGAPPRALRVAVHFNRLSHAAGPGFISGGLLAGPFHSPSRSGTEVGLVGNGLSAQHGEAPNGYGLVSVFGRDPKAAENQGSPHNTSPRAATFSHPRRQGLTGAGSHRCPRSKPTRRTVTSSPVARSRQRTPSLGRSVASQVRQQRRCYARAVLRSLGRTQHGQPTGQVHRVLREALGSLGARLAAATLHQLAADISAGRPVDLP